MSELAEIQYREEGKPFCLEVGHRAHYQKTGEQCSCAQFIDYKTYEQLQQQNRELVAANAQLGNVLAEFKKSYPNSPWITTVVDKALSKSPQASLAEIEAAAVEKSHAYALTAWQSGRIEFSTAVLEYAANLREGK